MIDTEQRPLQRTVLCVSLISSSNTVARLRFVLFRLSITYSGEEEVSFRISRFEKEEPFWEPGHRLEPMR